MGLTEEEKRTLIDIAKTTIECRITGKSIPEYRVNTETLKEKRGAFVTLKKHGHLRGCIGYIEAKKPLYKTVEQMAISAAFNAVVCPYSFAISLSSESKVASWTRTSAFFENAIISSQGMVSPDMTIFLPFLEGPSIMLGVIFLPFARAMVCPHCNLLNNGPSGIPNSKALGLLNFPGR